jgi:hypothetical protein
MALFFFASPPVSPFLPCSAPHYCHIAAAACPTPLVPHAPLCLPLTIAPSAHLFKPLAPPPSKYPPSPPPWVELPLLFASTLQRPRSSPNPTDDVLSALTTGALLSVMNLPSPSPSPLPHPPVRTILQPAFSKIYPPL